MKNTALLLIGFQNDYFSKDGILTGVVEETLDGLNVLSNTLKVIRHLPDEVKVVSTPIVFSDNYKELIEPVGILKSIAELGAFKRGTDGVKQVPEFKEFEDRITIIEGKHGLNAFIDTELESYLRKNDITRVVFAGCVCSICIDSTGRSAFEKGFEVVMLSDCITGRTLFEQEFYCEQVFPLYAKVMSSTDLINEFD